MFGVVLREIVRFIVIVLVALVLSFMLTRALGDPTAVLVDPLAGQEAREALRARLGLDQPLSVQFVQHVRDILSGDLRNSLRTGQPIAEELAARLPATFELVLLAVPLTLGLACAAAVIETFFSSSFSARCVRLILSLGFALPTFVTGTALLFIFAYMLPWFPAFGRIDGPIPGLWSSSFSSWKGVLSLVLPVLVLVLAHLSPLARFISAGLQRQSQSDSFLFARGLGTTRFRLILYWGLLPQAPAILIMLAMQAGTMFAFSLIVETVFQWPGLGSYYVLSLNLPDYPVISACVLVSMLAIATVNSLAQILAASLGASMPNRHIT
jgi:ABC-type dipeptide/oligopeptide/nickel transport system permease component